MNTRLEQMSAVLSKQVKGSRLPDVNDEIVKYVGLRNNRYVLNISEDHCKKIGISPFEYQRVVVDLGKINKLIAEAEKDPKHGIELIKPQELLLATKTKGFLESGSYSAVKEKIFIPAGYKKVRFSGARPKVAWVTSLVCGVSVGGGAFQNESLVGSIFLVRSYDMPLKMDNCNGEIYFQAGDPNGGSIWWELIK